MVSGFLQPPRRGWLLFDIAGQLPNRLRDLLGEFGGVRSTDGFENGADPPQVRAWIVIVQELSPPVRRRGRGDGEDALALSRHSQFVDGPLDFNHVVAPPAISDEKVERPLAHHDDAGSDEA